MKLIEQHILIAEVAQARTHQLDHRVCDNSTNQYHSTSVIRGKYAREALCNTHLDLSCVAIQLRGPIDTKAGTLRYVLYQRSGLLRLMPTHGIECSHAISRAFHSAQM